MIKTHKYIDDVTGMEITELSIPVSNLGYIVGKDFTYDQALAKLRANFVSVFDPLKEALGIDWDKMLRTDFKWRKRFLDLSNSMDDYKYCPYCAKRLEEKYKMGMYFNFCSHCNKGF